MKTKTSYQNDLFVEINGKEWQRIKLLATNCELKLKLIKINIQNKYPDTYNV